VGYRTEFLSFGLEGVPSASMTPANNSREALLDRLLKWLDDTVAVQLDSTHFVGRGPLNAVTVSATATPSIAGSLDSQFTNSIVEYRWDFGDGSAIQTTSANSASPLYKADGFYKVKVEAIDGFGHHGISNVAVVEVSPHIYLPIVNR
jgi:hypothetical protein